MCAQQKKIITCVWGLHSTGRIRWVGVYISFQKIRLRSLTTTTRKTTKNTINNISSLSVFPSFPFSLSRKKKKLTLSRQTHTDYIFILDPRDRQVAIEGLAKPHPAESLEPGLPQSERCGSDHISLCASLSWPRL